MRKTIVMGVAALMLSAGPAAAGEWEAVSFRDTAAMAVDWYSLWIIGTRRQINTSLVMKNSEPGSFDWATSKIEFDCAPSSLRYKTMYSSFFHIDGSPFDEDYVGDNSWTEILPGAMMNDLHGQVCAASTGKQGYFDDPHSFAVTARRVLQEG